MPGLGSRCELPLIRECFDEEHILSQHFVSLRRPRVIVYNKGPTSAEDLKRELGVVDEVVDLPNVGREGATVSVLLSRLVELPIDSVDTVPSSHPRKVQQLNYRPDECTLSLTAALDGG